MRLAAIASALAIVLCVAVFGAIWRGMEAKIVECPALSDSMPEFKTTYDVEPHAELLGFDDRAWKIIAADDLGIGASGARDLPAFADLDLDVVDNGADRNVARRHRISWLHVHVLAGDDRVTRR